MAQLDQFELGFSRKLGRGNKKPDVIAPGVTKVGMVARVSGGFRFLLHVLWFWQVRELE
jgi:hypothetical protein